MEMIEEDERSTMVDKNEGEKMSERMKMSEDEKERRKRRI
jgi:hypothetical protein